MLKVKTGIHFLLSINYNYTFTIYAYEMKKPITKLMYNYCLLNIHILDYSSKRNIIKYSSASLW